MKKMLKADRIKMIEEVKRKGLLKKTIGVDTKYNILAIDPATNCGWALDFENNVKYGCWTFNIKKGMSPGMKWVQFEKMIIEAIDTYKINIVAFELPMVRMHAGAAIHHAKFNGIIEKVCAQIGVEYVTYSPTEIKKFATGKGNAKKDQMIIAAKEKLDYVGENDNEADALWILNLCKSNLIKNSKI